MTLTNDQARDLVDLLRKTEALGLTFECGNAYIRRSYIDKQEVLRARVKAAIDLLSDPPTI